MDFNSRAIAVFKIAYTIKCMAYEPHNINACILVAPAYSHHVGDGILLRVQKFIIKFVFACPLCGVTTTTAAL